LFIATAMSQTTSRLSFVLVGVDVEEQTHHLRAAGAEATGLRDLPCAMRQIFG
jgi:hypothetical protein